MEGSRPILPVQGMDGREIPNLVFRVRLRALMTLRDRHGGRGLPPRREREAEDVRELRGGRRRDQGEAGIRKPRKRRRQMKGDSARHGPGA